MKPRSTYIPKSPPIRSKDIRLNQIIAYRQSLAIKSRLHSKKYHLAEILPDGSWKGSRCFIIGGGPSLSGFNFEELRGEKTIAINAAFRYIPFADLLFSMDHSFYRNMIRGVYGPEAMEGYRKFPGIKCFLEISDHHYENPVYYVHGDLRNKTLPIGLRNGIYPGANSGFGALMIAICLGADPIYLLGFDMTFQGTQTHFHRLYKKMTVSKPRLDSYRRNFENIAPLIREKGIRVINLNPASKLRCFDFSTFQEVMNGNDHYQGSEASDPI
jgi:hypothetical protein